MKTRIAFLVLAVVGTLSLFATPALARTVSCGDTITADTTLHRDVTNCAGNGLVIGADNIRLNLNGHTISGDNAEVSECPAGAACDIGVLNEGHDDVTVSDGTLTGFTAGVSISASRDNRVSGVASHNALLGVVVDSSDRAIVKNNVLEGGVSGVALFDTRRSEVSRNSASGSEGFSIYLGRADRNVVRKNVLDANKHGIAVQEGSSGNTVQRNTVTHGGGIDVGGDAATANRIEHNRLVDADDGVIVGDAQDTLIDRNVITGAGFGPDSGGFGVILDGPIRTTVERNIITGGRGPAILVTSLERPAGHDTTIARNFASSVGDDAIRVDNGATGTRIERNTAIDSADDGIDVDVAVTTLARNTASRNADLGIEAVAGVTDAGGNRAFGNGNPAQCVTVMCAP
jgi:parallel beta-helix repeat protein